MKNNWRKLYVFIPLIYIFFFLTATGAKGQTIIFYFIAPNSTIKTNFAGKLDSLDCPRGYSHVQITASNVAKFNAIAPANIKYVYTQLQPGTTLRNNINLVLKNSGGAVKQLEYWLADDNTGIDTSKPGTFLPYDDGGTFYVWPAASNMEYPKASKKFIGWAMFGEHQLTTDQTQRTGGMKAVDEVVLHETSHTQWTGEWTKWGGVNGHATTYGADGSHYFSIAELIGDQEGALNEGIATFYGFILNDQALDSLMAEYTSTGYRYFVEARSVLAGSADLYKVKDRISTNLTDDDNNVKHYEDGDAIVIFSYRWQSVPGWYLLFAESTSTAFFSIFRNHAFQNKDTAFGMIRHTSYSMSADRKKRFLTYACNRLALRMEEYNNSATGKADGNKLSSLFPFALLDLLTHFGMSDADYQGDYNRNSPDRNPKAYAEYFARRNAIKSLVQADINSNPIKFMEALNKIKNYCKQPTNMF